MTGSEERALVTVDDRYGEYQSRGITGGLGKEEEEGEEDDETEL